jgi:hypothetical protein
MATFEQYYELCDELIVSDHGFRTFVRPESLIFDVDRRSPPGPRSRTRDGWM